MGQWFIEGADRETGEEIFTTIVATTSEEALARAAERGMLVSKISAMKGSQSPPTRSKIPDYSAIISGAKMLRFFGTLWYIVAFLAMAIGVFIIVYAAHRAAQDDFYDSRSRIWVSALTSLGTLMAVCLTAVIYGVLLRMLGALALAVRDIARNSFK